MAQSKTRQLVVVSDRNPENFRLADEETGQLIANVQSLKVERGIDAFLQVEAKFFVPPESFKKQCPECGTPRSEINKIGH